MRLALRAGALLLALPLLGGCEIAGGIAGGASGLVTGAVTTNVAVGYAVGLGVRVATDAMVASWMRGLQQDEQDAIAAVIGDLGPEEVRPWKAGHGLPFGYKDAEGTVRLVRLLDTPLAQCREALFTLAGETPEGPPAGIFVTTVCRQSEGWKWAIAEPAVERWGALQ
ncbi:hypothetical protein [Roseomonas sp. KE0001]|uniref:hypothetical protein n=1 Tax=unclassified Roseomonas TaxID=2617492 RepID=UPI0018DFE178|nr:hypothetical protein [Roseomonas sp. KE0001]MBI0432593.1 hypothetical protein [Roseomonas sp. KE0001]